MSHIDTYWCDRAYRIYYFAPENLDLLVVKPINSAFLTLKWFLLSTLNHRYKHTGELGEPVLLLFYKLTLDLLQHMITCKTLYSKYHSILTSLDETPIFIFLTFLMFDFSRLSFHAVLRILKWHILSVKL